MRESLILVCVMSLVILSIWSAYALPKPYPETPQIPIVDVLHGVKLIDPYRWLEDGSDPRVLSWTEAQNQLTRAYLDAIASDNTQLDRRLNELLRYETTTFIDTLEGSKRFVWLRRADDEQERFGYRPDAQGAFIELLDPNQWPKGDTLEFAVPSLDGAYVAYGVSHAGDENPVIRVLEVETARHLDDTVTGRRQGWVGSIAWCPKNEGFYFGAFPGDDDYFQAMYYHRLGTQAEEDRKVFYHETVREYLHDLALSDDGQWLVLIRRNGSEGSEVYLGWRGQDEQSFFPLATGFHAHYHASFAGSQLILTTDENAPNSKAYQIDPKRPQRDHWVELLPESHDSLIDLVGVGGRFYATYLHNASTRIETFDQQGHPLGELILPKLGTASISGLWSAPSVWVDFSSFVQPLTRYRYDPDKQMLEEVYAPSVAFDLTGFTVQQVWYPSHDGERISMFLLQGPSADGPQPTLLTGYGGFGISITPAFSSFYIPFLEAGGRVAIPNLRGGGEYGEAWHEAGKKEKKQNVFHDFIAAAEWLIQQGMTTPEKLAIRGRSNGGLLVGAALTQRPDLFQAVLCDVPLLDMLRYHRFGFSNIWAVEYGCAEDPEDFRYLLEYSPYQRVVDGQRYPSVLIRGAENDARTDPLHARKMVARLQAAEPDRGRVKLLLIDSGAGHLGGGTVSQHVQDMKVALAFLLHQLRMACVVDMD